MSAYVVGKEHIDALVRLASEGPSGYHGGPGGAWGGYYYVEDRLPGYDAADTWEVTTR